MAEIVSFTRTSEESAKYAQRSIQRHISEGTMTEQDASIIQEFVTAMRIQNNIGDERAYKLTNGLTNICRFVKTPLMENTIADINAGILAIKNGQKISRPNHRHPGPLSLDTKRDYIIFLKRLYLWAIEEGYCNLSSDKIRKIKAPSANKATKTAEQMLTKSEIMQMIDVCTGRSGIRDAAMIAVLYEAGLRINELAHLKWSDIKFEGPFVKLNVSSKTGIPRYIPLTSSMGYLIKWRNIYPDGDPEGDKPVFLTTCTRISSSDNQKNTAYKTLKYNYLRQHIQNIGKRANIQKKVTCHLFRHSRVTALLQDGFQESTIKMMLWGSLTSKMLANYGHLCNNDIDSAVAKAAGLDLEVEVSENQFKNRICPRCHTLNTPTAKYCNTCGMALTKEVAMELDDAKNEIHSDERYKIMFENLQKQIDSLSLLCKKPDSV